MNALQTGRCACGQTTFVVNAPKTYGACHCEMFFNTIRRFLIICILGLSQQLAAAEIAITLDDLPYVLQSRTTPAEGLAQVTAINRALSAHDITATGFAVGQNIKRETHPVIDAFVQAGHSIGNHSWSHPDYGTLTKRQFRREVRKTDKALRKWMDDPKFYRFPYLREGETEHAKRDAENVLAEFGYTNVPVTIDNDEWQFNADYLDALAEGDQIKADQVAANYLAHMKERTEHFQKLAQSALGRDVAHILLLHLNQINADHLGVLLDWLAFCDRRASDERPALHDVR